MNIKDKGILVGLYNEKDLTNGKDKADIKAMSEETGYQYTNTELIERNGKVVGIKVYVCSKDDFKM